jgi:hypothetical protein
MDCALAFIAGEQIKRDYVSWRRLEVTDACVAIWGANRVGVHLSPRSGLHSKGDSDPAATCGYVARELVKRGIAFICSREALGDGRLGPALKAAFGGVYIANEKMNKKTAEQLFIVVYWRILRLRPTIARWSGRPGTRPC